VLDYTGNGKICSYIKLPQSKLHKTLLLGTTHLGAPFQSFKVLIAIDMTVLLHK